ncbi:MAG: hypothetical protein H8E70_01380 [Candidatus Marinimicrobia bacterium]|nr:hypothetical protein [Candidatus Neomarinimicrobiota bacterium]
MFFNSYKFPIIFQWFILFLLIGCDDQTENNSDNTSPELTVHPSEEYISGTSVSISWSWDELATGIVQYGLDSLFTQESGNSDQYATDHIVILNNLQDTSLYTYRVTGWDEHDNRATSESRQFVTYFQDDMEPPEFILDMHSIQRRQNSITISWTANEEVEAVVYYGFEEPLLDSVIVDQFSEIGEVTISELSPGLPYIFDLRIYDQIGFTIGQRDTFYTVIADFVLYDGQGSWAEGLVNEKNLLNDMGITWITVSQDYINSTELFPYFKAIWMPGGWAGDYKNVINAQGEENIKQLIDKGGLYVGSCAGGYYASDSTIWENVHYDNPLNFFEGSAVGPLNELAPWPSYTYTDIDINNEFEPLSDLPDTMAMLYYGGAYYQPMGQLSSDAHVLARYGHNGEIMALLNPYGDGFYFITGCHPEVKRVSQPIAWPFSSAIIYWAMDQVWIEHP